MVSKVFLLELLCDIQDCKIGVVRDRYGVWFFASAVFMVSKVFLLELLCDIQDC